MRRRRSHRSADRHISRGVYAAAVVGSALAAFVVTSMAIAAFNSAVLGGPLSTTTKRIFPGARTTSAWDLWDTSGGGGGSNQSSAIAFAGDSLTATTNNFSSSWSTSRYVDFVLPSPLPGGLSTSSATFDFTYGRSGSGTTCFYFEVRRTSTGTVIGTHGSSGSPVGCTSSSTGVPTSTSLPEVTSSDIANDLTIRVYGQNSGSHAMLIDRATVGGSTYASFSLYPSSEIDMANGLSATTTTWGPAIAGDNAAYLSKNNWLNAFNTGRWLRFTFPAYLPTGAVVTSATFGYSYKSNTALDTACWYFEVYDGATLLATHGSAASPVSCNATVNFVTDNVSLPEVSTAAIANNVVVKVYMRDTLGMQTQTDLASLTVNYYLD
jgi:hypothetical protein